MSLTRIEFYHEEKILINMILFTAMVTCTWFGFRITKDGTHAAVPIDVTLLLETRQIYKQMLTDSSQISRSGQKHLIPGFTPYFKGLELALNF